MSTTTHLEITPVGSVQDVCCTQPTISHHLKVLVDAGILSRNKRGVWAYYAIVPGAFQALGAVLGDTGQLARQSC